MSVLLSFVIALAMLLNLYRLFHNPWPLFAFPFWIYLAWTHWGEGSFNLVVALLLLVLLFWGRRKRNAAFRRRADDDEEPDDEDEGLAVESTSEMNLTVSDPDPSWRSKFPEESRERAEQKRARHANLLAEIRENPSQVWITPENEMTSEELKSIIDALWENLGTIEDKDINLEFVVSSLDKLTMFDPAEGARAFSYVRNSLAGGDKEAQLIPALRQGAIWSQHTPKTPPDEATYSWVRRRLQAGNSAEVSGAVSWLVERELFDWETGDEYLKKLTVDEISELLYWNQGRVPSSELDSVFSIWKIRYLESREGAESVPSSTLRKCLLRMAHCSRIREDSSEEEIRFSGAVSAFLTLEMRCIPEEAFEDYDMATLWAAYARDCSGHEVAALLKERLGEMVPQRVRLDALAGLASSDPEMSVSGFLDEVEKGNSLYGSGEFAMQQKPFRNLMRDRLIAKLRESESFDRFPERMMIEFLLRFSDNTVLSFFFSRMRSLSFRDLVHLSEKVVPHSGKDIFETLQGRGMLDSLAAGDFELKGNFDSVLFHHGLPYSCHLSSDSDEYPPRYDDAIREMVIVSCGGFPAERVKQSVVSDPEREYKDAEIEVSWFLDDRKCSFVFEYIGDYLNVRLLVWALNESLRQVGRTGRFFGAGDWSYGPQVVFGDPGGWMQASYEFCVPLFSEPEEDWPELSEATARERLIRRIGELYTPMNEID